MKRWAFVLLAVLLASTAGASGADEGGEGFVTLENDYIRAVIAPRQGGELAGLAVRLGGQWHELIYRAKDYSETSGWRGKSPLLWPAVGRTVAPGGRANVWVMDGAERTMTPHGFAHDHRWRITGREDAGNHSAATLEMADAERDDGLYPFDYRLEVKYRLFADRLILVYTVDAEVENSAPMPFSIGNHITFRAPLVEGTAAGVEFKTGLPRQLIRDSDKVFSGEIIPSPFTGRHTIAELPRRDAVSLGGQQGQAELTVFDPSGLQVRLVHRASSEPSEPAIRFNLWADPVEGFFSPEPWIGTQNALNSGAGLVRLEPGQAWTWQIEIIPFMAAKPVMKDKEEPR